MKRVLFLLLVSVFMLPAFHSEAQVQGTQTPTHYQELSRSTNGPRSANGPTIRSAPKSSHPCMRKARPAICRSCPTTT